MPRPISSRMTRLFAVACARIAAVSTISTMKVDRPRARLSDAPTRLNRRSIRPIRRARRRDVATGLGEQHDQRRLAQEGRLAAHVRAGDQPQAIVGTQRDIIGDEALAGFGKRALDHRMPPALDLQAGLVVQFGQAPAALGGALGIGGGDIDPRDRVGASRRSPRPQRWQARSIPRNARLRRPARDRPPRRPSAASSCRSGELNRTTPARVWRWVKPLSGAISRSAKRAVTST